MLNPYELQVFLAAADEESFSAAGRRLHLTQSAVSQEIHSLEQQLQVELFHRDGPRVSLTEDGRALMPMAREYVHLSSRIEESMAARRGMITGQLTIGCTSTPGKYTLPWLVGSFCQEYPQVKIAVEIVKRADLVQKLEQHAIDLGLMSGQVEHPDLIYDEFMQDNLVLIVPARHPFADQEVVSPEQLKGQTVILREEAAGTRIALLEGLENIGIGQNDLKVAPIVLGTAESIISAVEAGWGISWVSMVAAQRAVEMGKIRLIEVEGLHLRRTIYLVRNRQHARTEAHLKFYEYTNSPAGQTILHRLGVK
ncbi:MAG TPA: LysR family transcriptional regulator [Anaerolineaceae bacterium]|nr:LysR family transcriptional regulator [Anaerolineaceae bacterium]